MILYLDTSVLVSCYVPEGHSQNILELLQKNQEQPYISRLTEVEFYSALAMKKRNKEISQHNINIVTALFNQHLSELMYQRIYIIDTLFEKAIGFLNAYRTQLRTLDALHLACSAAMNATLVTADKILAYSGKQLDIPTLLLG